MWLREEANISFITQIEISTMESPNEMTTLQ